MSERDIVEDLREHAYRVAGGHTGDPNYDPETLGLELDAADEIERLRSSWRPIEEAPKDGTDVLLWDSWSKEPVIGRWWSGEWRTPEEPVSATYYAPLPPPPETKE